MKNPRKPLYAQKGVAAVEFALVSLFFFMLLFGVIEFARVLFTWNSAAEATRYGARVAVVCDIDRAGVHDVVLNKMRRIMPDLPADPGVVAVDYEPSGCTKDGTNPCRWVTVSIKKNSLPFKTYIPFIDPTTSVKVNNWFVPSFSTTLPRESLDSAGHASFCS